MMKKRMIVVLVAAALAILIPAAISSTAATSWKTFGYANGQNHGWYGQTTIDIHSTTKRDPLLVRVQLYDGSRTNKSYVDTNISCFEQSGTRLWERGWANNGGMKPLDLPLTKTWDPPGWVDYCTVQARAFHDEEGYMKGRVQAKYAD